MAFGKRIDVPGGHRRKQRERVVLAGTAVMPDRTRSVVVDDVCSTGLRLRGSDLPSEGQELLLKIGHVDVMGFVAWSGGYECGFTFASQLEPAGVKQLKNAGRVGRGLGIL